ncbi:MAG: hypothetical protein JNK33_00060 [Candidatus Doudnabacteria bacterium]|nr:hypothetical protein [Candidatus Doudnabacteria bacterium]
MVKQLSHKKRNTRKVVLISLAAVLTIGLLLVVLEKTHVTNFIALSPSAPASPAKTTSDTDVNYNPPSSNETGLADQIKNQAQQNNQDSSSTSNTAQVSLSAAAQDETGGPIVVRAIVSIQSGNCTINLSGSNYNKDFTSSIKNLETYYSCSLDIPISDIPAGNYTIMLTAKNDTATGSDSQKVEVRK